MVSQCHMHDAQWVLRLEAVSAADGHMVLSRISYTLVQPHINPEAFHVNLQTSARTRSILRTCKCHLALQLQPRPLAMAFRPATRRCMNALALQWGQRDAASICGPPLKQVRRACRR